MMNRCASNMAVRSCWIFLKSLIKPLRVVLALVLGLFHAAGSVRGATPKPMRVKVTRTAVVLGASVEMGVEHASVRVRSKADPKDARSAPGTMAVELPSGPGPYEITVEAAGCFDVTRDITAGEIASGTIAVSLDSNRLDRLNLNDDPVLNPILAASYAFASQFGLLVPAKSSRMIRVWGCNSSCFDEMAIACTNGRVIQLVADSALIQTIVRQFGEGPDGKLVAVASMTDILTHEGVHGTAGPHTADDPCSSRPYWEAQRAVWAAASAALPAASPYRYLVDGALKRVTERLSATAVCDGGGAAGYFPVRIEWITKGESPRHIALH